MKRWLSQSALIAKKVSRISQFVGNRGETSVQHIHTELGPPSRMAPKIPKHWSE